MAQPGDQAAFPAAPLSISIRLVWRGALLLIALLLIAHIAGQFSEHILDKPNLKGFVPRTNMNGELSLPTLVATFLLAGCAGLLTIIARLASRAGDRFARWWIGLALLFVYIAVDEAIALHEMVIAPLRELLGVTDGWLFFAWVIPAAALALLIGLVYLPFLTALPASTRRAFTLAAALMLGGALGVELIGGWYLSTRGDGFAYELIGAVEETLELLGASLFLIALLAFIGRTTGEVRFAIELETSR